MSLNKLHIFKTVYEMGNTQEAAEKLNVTRSAVSQAVSKLEKELGVPLFTRLSKGLVPTPNAHRLAKNTGPLLDRINHELIAISRDQKSMQGVLHIGAPRTTGTLHMPSIIEMFKQDYPNVEIHLSLEFSTLLLSQLLQGELDFAIMDFWGGVDFNKDLQAYCHMEPIVEEIIVMLCSPKYYEAHINGDESYENLRSLDFMCMRPDALELRSWFQAQFSKVPRHFKRQLIVDNSLALMDGARRHLGLLVEGSNIAQRYVERGELVEVTPNMRGEKNSISLVQLLDKKPSQLEKAFISTIHKYAKEQWKSGV